MYRWRSRISVIYILKPDAVFNLVYVVIGVMFRFSLVPSWLFTCSLLSNWSWIGWWVFLILKNDGYILKTSQIVDICV